MNDSSLVAVRKAPIEFHNGVENYPHRTVDKGNPDPERFVSTSCGLAYSGHLRYVKRRPALRANAGQGRGTVLVLRRPRSDDRSWEVVLRGSV